MNLLQDLWLTHSDLFSIVAVWVGISLFCALIDTLRGKGGPK